MKQAIAGHRHRATQCAALMLWIAFAGAASAQSDSVGSEPAVFIGAYSLIEYAGHGDRPIGRIGYDGAGRMWAMLTPPGREPVSNDSSAEEYRAAMRGLIAYYGRYEVDATTGRVIHHVEAASNPAWIGMEFERWYRFEGERLTLSLNAEFSNALVWERLPE